MKRLSLRQTRWIWRGLIIGVILAGIYIVISLPPPGVETPEKENQTSSVSTEEDDGLSSKATAYITPEAMKDFISSLKKGAHSHDPFLRSGEQKWKKFLGELKDRPPRLKGIIQVEGTRVALIQNSRYREGDEVKGFQIIKIEDKLVLLTKGGKTYTVHLTK